MTELDRRCFPAVLAADAELDFGAGLTAELTSHLHQLADPGLIDRHEGIIRINLLFDIHRQELASVIPGQAIGGLGQIVGKEKNSACSAMLSAVSAARGSSIMVPIRYSTATP